MSTNLFWLPIEKGKCLSKELKTIVIKSGFMYNSQTQTLGDGDIQPLKIIMTATSDDNIKTECPELIKAIEQYTEIEIYIE